MTQSHAERISPLLSIVVPVYNEAVSLGGLLPDWIPYCKKQNWTLILVNDGSTDDSRAILEKYENVEGICVVHHPVNRGYGGALKSGIISANTPYLVTVDGDGQHNPSDVEKVFGFALDNDADLVVGDRGRKWGADKYREVGKWVIRKFTRLLMPLPIYDLNSGFKLYRSELAKKYIRLCPDSMAFSNIIALIFINQHKRVLEYPITINDRKAGQSTISTYTAFETMIETIKLVLSFNPLRLFLPFSLFCLIAGFGWGIPFLIVGHEVSLGAVLAIVTGLLLLAVGLISSQSASIRMGLLNKE